MIRRWWSYENNCLAFTWKLLFARTIAPFAAQTITDRIFGKSRAIITCYPER